MKYYVSGTVAVALYFIVPDILDRPQTILFLIVMFGTSMYVIESISAYARRIRAHRDRLSARKRRKVIDISVGREKTLWFETVHGVETAKWM